MGTLGARWQTPTFLRLLAATAVAFMIVKSPGPLTIGGLAAWAWSLHRAHLAVGAPSLVPRRILALVLVVFLLTFTIAFATDLAVHGHP